MVRLDLIKNVIGLLEQFESENQPGMYEDNIEGFLHWIISHYGHTGIHEELPFWENQDKGRSAESVICTLFVHINTYAKRYSRAAVLGSEMIAQEDFIYLITLKAFGPMTKMELIRKNLHEKSSGMSIISRLTLNGWIKQRIPDTDKRKKLLALSQEGELVLEKIMPKIRTATKIVSANLTYKEKLELIRILTKLDHFHQEIFSGHHEIGNLLETVETRYFPYK